MEMNMPSIAVWLIGDILLESEQDWSGDERNEVSALNVFLWCNFHIRPQPRPFGGKIAANYLVSLVSLHYFGHPP